jgi:uncharacterized protein (TIGR03437 family)
MVQIPVDLAVGENVIAQKAPGTSIIVSDTTKDSWTISNVLVDPVKLHILTQCDAIAFGFSYSVKSNYLSPCNPLITHADGTLVTQPTSFGGPFNKAAQPGETLVMYAYGLGATQPAVPAGTVSPTPAAVINRHFSLVLDYDCGTIVTTIPTFIGLTPGQVGLYQVNFVVPQPVACTTLLPDLSPQSGGNLTLLSDDWVSSDTVLLYLGANTPASGTNVIPAGN